MSCPDCEQMRKTNKELHRRAQKAESDKATIFKAHNPQLSELEAAAHLLQDYSGRLRRLYKSEWRKFQTDDPKFHEAYGQYIDKRKFYEQFKKWITGGKK